MSAAFKPGDRVTWMWHPRGGYGYVIPVPAWVVKVGPKRVTIDALKADGTTVRRHVPAKHLRERPLP